MMESHLELVRVMEVEYWALSLVSLSVQEMVPLLDSRLLHVSGI